MKKKTLTRILSICLMLMLAVSLAACGNKDTEPEAASASAASSSEEAEEPEEVVEEEPEETVEEEPEEPEETVAESTEETEEAETEPAEETTVPSDALGTLTETSYVNNYFGLRYDAPADWYVLSRDETAALTGLAASNIDNEKILEMFESTGYVTDFYAIATTPSVEGADIYNTANITIQDIGKLYGILYDEKLLAEASIDSVKEALEAQGLTDITTEISEMEFLGKTSVISIITSKAGDFNMYQKQVYLKNGSAVACITATSPGEDKTDEILAMFAESTGEEAAADETATDATATDTATADAGAIAGMPLSSGAISVDGDLFVLGSNFRDVQASGWSLTQEDEEKYQEYTLNPRTTSGGAMGVYKDAYGYDFNSFHVMVSLMNASESSIPYLDGTVDYLSIPRISQVETPVPVVFPGGLTTDSTEEEFVAVYGQPTYEYEDEETEFRSVTFEDGDVELQIIWTKGVINEITMMS